MELESLHEEWELKSLGEVAEYINGYHFGPNDWKSSGIPIIRIQNLNDPEAPFNYFEGEIGEKYFVENGDLLISWSASLGAYFWNRGKALLNQHIFKVVENEALITKDYLFYFISSILEDIKRKTHGSTMKHITKKDFEIIKIPLPPLEEQKKIVEIIQFADYLRERRKEAKELIDKIVMSVFYDMFGDPAINQKGWEMKRLEEVAGVRSSSMNPQRYPEEKFELYSIPAFDNNLTPEIKFGKEIKSNKTEIEPDDCLISRINPRIRRIWVVQQMKNFKQIASTEFLSIYSKERHGHPYFLHVFLAKGLGTKSKWVEIKSLVTATTGSRQRFRRQDVLKIKMLIPPLDLQQEFAEIVSKLEEKRKQMEEAEEKLEMLYQILLKQAFTGKLTEEWRIEKNASKAS